MSKETREIERIASEWLAHRISGNWSEDDSVRFAAWLNASTVHRVAFLRLELGWEETRRLKALAAGVRSETPPPPGQWNLSPFFGPIVPAARRHPFSGRLRLTLAASVLLAATWMGVWFIQPVGERYATPIGSIASVPMIDGSTVTLNTDSQIRVALTDVERRVDLKQGEAFFKVAKDPKRPFVVEAGGKRFVAVGTQFSVRRVGDTIRVVVTEGKVRVEDASLPLRGSSVGPPGSASPESLNAPIILSPGAIARVDKGGVLVQRKTLPEAEEELTWRAGVLVFRNETLADAIAEFNRYTTRKVVIADPAVAGLKIEGNFRLNNAPAFLELLEAGFPVRVIQEPDEIVLTSR